MNGKQWASALLTLGLVGAAACQRAPQPAPPVATEGRPVAAATPVEPWRAFQPPPDGRLTTAQVEMYIAVRRQAVPSPKAAPLSAGQLVDVVVAERRAMSQQGHDAEEYRWVSARIAEASRPDTDALGELAGAIEAASRKGREQVLEKAARERVPVTPDGARARQSGAGLQPGAPRAVPKGAGWAAPGRHSHAGRFAHELRIATGLRLGNGVCRGC